MQRVLYGVGAFLGLLIVIGFLLPGTNRVTVSAEIDAPAATVFAQLNDQRRANLWSPVTAVDPNARIEFSGPARGAGATITWDGTIAGSGTRTIVESRPHEYIENLINGGEPGESRSRFELFPLPGGTRVDWTFEHDYGLNVVGRYFGVLIGGVIRRDNQAALSELAALAESLPRTDWSGLEIERLLVEPLTIAYRTTTSAPDPTAMSEALGDAYFEVLAFIDENRLSAAGAPLSIARAFSGACLSFDAAIPVRGLTDATPSRSGDVRIGRTFGGTVIRVRHVGPYRTLVETHRKIAAYLAALGIERDGDAWESYVSDPTEVDDANLVTYVYYPVRDRP